MMIRVVKFLARLFINPAHNSSIAAQFSFILFALSQSIHVRFQPILNPLVVLYVTIITPPPDAQNVCVRARYVTTLPHVFLLRFSKRHRYVREVNMTPAPPPKKETTNSTRVLRWFTNCKTKYRIVPPVNSRQIVSNPRTTHARTFTRFL